MNTAAFELKDVLILAAMVLVVAAVAALLHRILKKYFARKKSLGEAFQLRMIFPTAFLLLFAGLKFMAVREAILSGTGLYPILDAALLYFIVLFIIRLGDGLFRRSYLKKGKQIPLPSVLHGFILAVIYLAVFFIILRGILDINITPFLATSALLTAILGLAFQDALSNVVSGISLHFTKSFDKGHWVEIGGHEGVVVDTNWRETRIFDRKFNIIVVPNNKAARENIINYSLPDRKTALLLPLKVSFSAEPSLVFAALREAALENPKVLHSPAPVVQIHGYDDVGVDYKLKFFITDFAQKYPILADVSQKIWYKFKRNGIEIPIALGDRVGDVLTTVFQREASRLREAEESEIFTALKQSTLLRDGAEGPLLVEEKQIKSLTPHITKHHYAAGEILFRQGEPGETCYIIVKGIIRGEIAYEESGKPYKSEFRVERGGVFGEMSLFTGLPRTATGIIEEPAELLEINADIFGRLLENNPSLAETIADMVSRRNQANQEFYMKIKELSSQQIEESTNRQSILTRLLSFLKL
jgi:small-conductance mechanosensitive channel/CRP-like cAMP-binding protein